MEEKPKEKPPWKRKNPNKNPNKNHTKLTDEEKDMARARAAMAVRRYPNLIDNIWAAREKKKRPE